MIDFRCQNCKKLLFKGEYEGVIQVMCHRCKTINEIECQGKEHQSK